MYFPYEKGKSEHHHWILHIRISLSTKLQVKLTILIFWTKCAQKGYFWSKTQNRTFACVHPWLLLIMLNFSARGLTETTVILMSLLLLVTETIVNVEIWTLTDELHISYFSCNFQYHIWFNRDALKTQPNI